MDIKKNNYFSQKERFIKGMPRNRKENFKNIYIHNFDQEESVKLSNYFDNLQLIRTNHEFGYEYILNSLNTFDLILINNNLDNHINYDLIYSFLDILSNNGEIWIFCDKTHKINGDEKTKEIIEICHRNELHYYKCCTQSRTNPIDVLMINKEKNISLFK